MGLASHPTHQRLKAKRVKEEMPLTGLLDFSLAACPIGRLPFVVAFLMAFLLEDLRA